VKGALLAQKARLAGSLHRTFRSLHVRNYRLWFLGQTVSQSGTWMQAVAQSWLVWTLTRSAFDLGLTAALQFAPVLLLGTVGGVIADRFDKRKSFSSLRPRSRCRRRHSG